MATPLIAPIAALLACITCWPVSATCQTVVHQVAGGMHHEMVVVPGGEFTMGQPGYWWVQQRVYVDSFLIDKYEVTRGRYVRFLNATGSHMGADGQVLADIEREPHFQPAFTLVDGEYWCAGDEDFPASGVTWAGARAYCLWAGLRLPTEAEWERAARGADERVYPWGNDLDRSKANWGGFADYGGIVPDDSDGYLLWAPVGSYPDGASPYGALDMAGNVSEWVYDWQAPYRWNANVVRDNPRGPDTGVSRIGRGGDYCTVSIQTYCREWLSPTLAENMTGLRCARDLRTRATSVEPTSWGIVKSGVGH